MHEDKPHIVRLFDGSGQCFSALIFKREDRERFIARAERAQYTVYSEPEIHLDQYNHAEAWLSQAGQARF